MPYDKVLMYLASIPEVDSPEDSDSKTSNNSNKDKPTGYINMFDYGTQ